MEAYPHAYLAPCVPLYVISGVDAPNDLIQDDHSLQRNGSRIGPDNPTVHDDRSQKVLKAFLDLDYHHESSTPIPEKGRVPPVAFRVSKDVRVMHARKASPQASPAEAGFDSTSPMTAPSQNTLHSPLSPLTVGSPLFADGIMTPLWNAKHQSMVPSVFMTFYKITKESGSDSLNDNRLKNEIAGVKQTLMDSRYRTRLVVILIATDNLGTSNEVEERLFNIRNGARLDDKSLYYLPAAVEEHELRSFAADICSSLRSVSTDFYRDLTKHSRRKRDRGANPTPPPQAGKVYSNGITRYGWVARYEYKLGLFAEYRGEPDVSERHYTGAMNALFDPQGPFENLSCWSPRFNETRTFADITYIRLIRCQLLTSNPTSAVKTWLRHRDTVRELVERKGKGTANYGWDAWESRWPRVMAELVQESKIPFPKSAPYANVESFLLQELQQFQITILPWEKLHHAGYWNKLAAVYAAKRLKQAKDIPEEDRVPPGQSPASAVARRNDKYDSYMAADPHVEWQTSQKPDGEHVQDIVACLGHAIQDYSKHRQPRQADEVRVDFCKKLVAMGRYDDAINSLKGVWKSNRWRSERWLQILQVSSHALFEAAVLSHDVTEQISALWELQNDAFKPIPNFDYDLPKLLKEIEKSSEQASTPINIELDDSVTWSFVRISINFGRHEARAGEPLSMQLVIKSNAHASSTPLRISNLSLKFEGTLPGFEVDDLAIDEEPSSSLSSISTLDFGGQRASLGAPMSAKADLRITAGQTKVFDFSLAPSEAGSITATSATAIIREGDVTIKYTARLGGGKQRQPWLIGDKSGNVRPSHTKHRISAPVSAVKVLPRPPKMDITMIDLSRVCYTDERNTSILRLINKESEEADVKVDITAVSGSDHAPFLSWVSDDEEQQQEHVELSLGSVEAGATIERKFELHSATAQTDLTVEARVMYTLPSKVDVQITKTVTEELVIIQPFEATHHIKQDYHPDKWPSYFSLDDTVAEPNARDAIQSATGIPYRYRSETSVVSFATETLIVEKMELALEDTSSHAQVTSTAVDNTGDSFEMASNGTKVLKCQVNARKSDLDERKSITTEPVLLVTWRRAGSPASDNVSTRLPLPQLSLGSSEPRVLVRRIETSEPTLVALDYVFENPSAHFLTFNYSMEPSEDFAFSGPKLAALQLTPLSRTSVRYVLWPCDADKRMRPRFHVEDAYFNKTLGVVATGRLVEDEDGIVL